MTSLVETLAVDAEIAAHLSGEAEISAILRFETALAEAEAEVGLIAQDAADAVAAAIARFKPDYDVLAAGLAEDGVVVPALLRQLRESIGEPHASALHFGATSQDAADTGLMLRLAAIIPILLERTAAMEKTLAAISESQGDLHILAHTRMQAALPFTVRDKIATWAGPLARQRALLDRMRTRLLVAQLGGPVGDRAAFQGKGEALARRVAASLDLGVAEPWHSQRDTIVEFGSLLAILSGALGKFGMDVALAAQSEVCAIRLAGGGGSSSMPHKMNPVKAELLVALARYNAGLAGTLQQAMLHENERSGSAWTLEWLVLPQMLTTTGKSLLIARALADEIGFAEQVRPQNNPQ